MLLGFTSCRRFNGRFYLRPKSIEVVLDTEGLALAPGEILGPRRVHLSPAGPNRAALLSALADRIDRNHPPLRFKNSARRMVQLVLLRLARHAPRT